MGGAPDHRRGGGNRGGGIGSIVGSLVVAHVIGFMETITTTVVAAELRGVFTMALIIVVLIVAPKGLFGRREL